jgi:hypothetical protein
MEEPSRRTTILVTSLTKTLLPRLFNLAEQPALGRVLVVPNCFHFMNDKGHCFWGPSMLQTFVGTLARVCATTQSCLGALRTIPLSSWLGFCCQVWDHYKDKCVCVCVCAFPNHVQSIEFTTGGLQSSCRNILRMINGNRMQLSSISSLIAKGLDTYVNMRYFCLFVIHLQKYSLFSLCHYGILCVD